MTQVWILSFDTEGRDVPEILAVFTSLDKAHEWLALTYEVPVKWEEFDLAWWADVTVENDAGDELSAWYTIERRELDP